MHTNTCSKGGPSLIRRLLIVAVAAVALLVCWGALAEAGLGAGHYRLVQEPGAGFGGYYAQIRAARRSIDMEMYELKDTTVERDLVAATRRGVAVRVLLNRAFTGARVNAAAYSYLHAHGVPVRWGPAGTIFHIKATVFDGTRVDVSSANLTPEYYGDTRDATVIDGDPAQVRAIAATLAADWAGRQAKSDASEAAGLVWSPRTGSETAETVMLDQIRSARHSIEFESEELSDSWVYDALAAAAGRGVGCEVVMTRQSEWKSAFSRLAAAGCHVHTFPDSTRALYIHEKLLLTDGGAGDERLLIGSQNAGYRSLAFNRELSLQLSDADGGKGVIRSVAVTFADDYRAAPAW